LTTVELFTAQQLKYTQAAQQAIAYNSPLVNYTDRRAYTHS